jgi:DNA repair protein RadD
MKRKIRNRKMKPRGIRGAQEEIQLRPYQAESVRAAWDSCRGKKNPLIVLPTGAGKSLVIAQLIKDALKWDGRVVVLAHRKELLEQNSAEIEKLAGCEVGIYSAGLGRKETEPDVICAGIQSIYKYGFDLDRRHVIIVDEAHLIPDDASTMYGQFLTEMRLCNPGVFVIGLTATPFRTGEGEITSGELFDEICHEVQLADLINDGFLSPLTNQVIKSHIDSSKLPRARGEYKTGEMEAAFNEITEAAVGEIVESTSGRKSILIFCAGVHHAESVQREIEKRTGENVGLITGETLPMARENYIEQFRAGQIRWLINVNVLTTGFNATGVDCVAILRATTSPGLFAQMVGRGLRLHEGKENCLILDFGENLKRHGALDSPDFGRKSTKGNGQGTGPQKTCEHCQMSCAAGCTFCPHCSAPFPDREPGAPHEATADTGAAILVKDIPEAQPRTYKIGDLQWCYHKAKGEGKRDTLRVDYYCKPNRETQGDLDDLFKVSQWVCIEHQGGFALKKAQDFWVLHSAHLFPCDIHEAIAIFKEGGCRKPTSITIKRRGNFWDVLDYEFDSQIPEPVEKKTYSTDDIPF